MDKVVKIHNIIDNINEYNNMNESEEDGSEESEDEMYIDCNYHINLQILDNYKKMLIRKVNDYMELHLDDTMDEKLTFNQAKDIVIQEEDGSNHGKKLNKKTIWISAGINL